MSRRCPIERLVSCGASFRSGALTADGPHFVGLRWARTSATSLRAGQHLVYKGKLFTILKATHTKGTARQIGHVQLELRDVETQLKHMERLRSAADVELARLTAEKWKVLYTEQNDVVCMHPETYDQMKLRRAIFGNAGVYLESEMEVTVEFHDGNGVIGTVPPTVELRVRSIESEVSDGFRLATLSNGHTMKLPTFVLPDDVVRINTKDGTFMKRVEMSRR